MGGLILLAVLLVLTPEQIADVQAKIDEGTAVQQVVVDSLTAEQRQALIVEAQDELNKAVVEARRRQWTSQPDAWITSRLGEHLWSKQREICQSVAVNQRTAVPSCFASGKSWLAARIAAWWIDVHPPGTARVVTTASTAAQVKAILWMEIGRAHGKGQLPGRLNQTEWWLVNPDSGKEELVAFGRKPADMDATAFQGIHERYVLVILDEAAGVPPSLWLATEGLLTNDECRVLAIGNPEDGASEFAKACTPGSGWNVVRIRAWDTPNYTGEDVPENLHHLLLSRSWVEDKRKRWGEKSMMWAAKVEAEFPQVREDGLIPIAWIRAAQERNLEIDADGQTVKHTPRILGVDVGGGADKSVICARRGPVFRIKKRTQKPNTMDTLEDVVVELEVEGASEARVDEIGIGRGVSDAGPRHERVRKLGAKVIGVNVGRAAKDKEHFVNLRAEGFWSLRERFQDGLVDIDANDDDLAAQLVELRYKRRNGRIQIEEKDEMKKRLDGASPDDADAMMLSNLDDAVLPRAPRARVAVWG